jgi:hypothetical protein
LLEFYNINIIFIIIHGVKYLYKKKTTRLICFETIFILPTLNHMIPSISYICQKNFNQDIPIYIYIYIYVYIIDDFANTVASHSEGDA